MVIPVHTQCYIMLQWNLPYTGIRRGKQLVVLVGTPRAIGIAMKPAESIQRYSALRTRRMLPRAVRYSPRSPGQQHGA